MTVEIIKDRTVLSQVLKNQEVDSFIKLNIAKE